MVVHSRSFTFHFSIMYERVPDSPHFMQCLEKVVVSSSRFYSCRGSSKQWREKDAHWYTRHDYICGRARLMLSKICLVSYSALIFNDMVRRVLSVPLSRWRWDCLYAKQSTLCIGLSNRCYTLQGIGFQPLGAITLFLQEPCCKHFLFPLWTSNFLM